MKSPVILRLAMVLPALVVFVNTAQQTGQPTPVKSSDQATSPKVFANVIIQAPASGLPIRQLTKDDFRLFDDRHEVPITSFSAGERFQTRPVILWLVVLCNEGGKIGGSREFSGKEALFRPALDDLDKRDTVGVAHWCDNGDAQLDLLPTKDRDAVIGSLTKTLQPISFNLGANSNNLGEDAVEKLVRLILEQGHQMNPDALPAIVFLYGDYGSHRKQNLDYVLDNIAEISGIVFGIKDQDTSMETRVGTGSQARFVHYLADQTGGQYFSVAPKGYAAALGMILMQLHFRYELTFVPGKADGSRHEMKVELTKESLAKYKGAQVRYCSEYFPVAEPQWR